MSPEKYKDEYRIRVLAMLEEKSKRREITLATPEVPRHGQPLAGAKGEHGASTPEENTCCSAKEREARLKLFFLECVSSKETLSPDCVPHLLQEHLNRAIVADLVRELTGYCHLLLLPAFALYVVGECLALSLLT